MKHRALCNQLHRFTMDRILLTNDVTNRDSEGSYPVLAHAPEFHGLPAEPLEAGTLDDDNGSNSAVESEVPASSTEPGTTTVDAFVGESPPVAGVPDGLGESLLTILVAVPWVLIVLRMQLNPKSHS